MNNLRIVTPESFRKTRNGHFIENSTGYASGYSVYKSGHPAIDAVIRALERKGAKQKLTGTDSPMNVLQYCLEYGIPGATLVIKGGNYFGGGKGAWVSGSLAEQIINEAIGESHTEQQAAIATKAVASTIHETNPSLKPPEQMSPTPCGYGTDTAAPKRSSQDSEHRRTPTDTSIKSIAASIRSCVLQAESAEKKPFELSGRGHEPRLALDRRLAAILRDVSLERVYIPGYGPKHWYPTRVFKRAARALKRKYRCDVIHLTDDGQAAWLSTNLTNDLKQ